MFPDLVHGRNHLLWCFVKYSRYAYPNHSTTSDIYWNTVDTRNGYILQSNKVSDIYRVLNQETQPIFGTSKLREAETYFGRVSKEELMHV